MFHYYIGFPWFTAKLYFGIPNVKDSIKDSNEKHPYEPERDIDSRLIDYWLHGLETDPRGR